MYKTVYKIYNDRWLALLAILVIMFSPRIFAHSFINIKDLAFLSVFIICGYFFVRLIQNKSFKNIVLFSLIIAFCINIRILGVLWIPVTIVFLLSENIFNSENTNRIFIKITVFIILICVFTIVMWPYLWENPLNNFVQAYKNMSVFRWNNYVLYMGQYVHSFSIPWHYGIVYMFVTTPVLYVTLFISGVVMFFFSLLLMVWRISKFLKKIDTTEKERVNYIWIQTKNFYQKKKYTILAITMFFGPFLAIVIKESVLYDGWRHLYFLYYGFILIAIHAVNVMKKRYNLLKVNYIFAAITVVNLVVVGWFMIKYHPHQQTYFNFLAGKEPIINFEADYWAISSRQAFEYIEETDANNKILVTTSINAKIFDENRRYLKNPDKVYLSQIEDTTMVNDTSFESIYYLTNYRWSEYKPDNDKEVFSIMVKDNKIIQLLKLK